MKMSQNESVHNNYRHSTDSVVEVINNECSIIEIIDNENSRDSIIEISDGEDDNDECIDLSCVIEAVSDEDIEDIRRIIKTESDEDTDEGSQDAEQDVEYDESNFKCGIIISPSALAHGKALKRKHANIAENQAQKEPRKKANTAGSSKDPQNSGIAEISSPPSYEDSNEGTTDSIKIIKQESEDGIEEVLNTSQISMSCSSIKTEGESGLNQRISENNLESAQQQETPNYDISKIRWMRPLTNLSSPPHLQIVIVDRSDPNWKISNDKWLMIEKRLLEELHDEMLRQNDGSIGSFDGAKWSKGIKVIGCHNQKSLNFIKKFILRLDKLWIGAKLDVLPITQVSRHIVYGFVPPPAMRKDTVLSLIKLQNPSIYCDDWEIIQERERANGNGGRDVWISISSISFDLLHKTRGEIKYGINRIFLKPSH